MSVDSGAATLPAWRPAHGLAIVRRRPGACDGVVMPGLLTLRKTFWYPDRPPTPALLQGLEQGKSGFLRTLLIGLPCNLHEKYREQLEREVACPWSENPVWPGSFIELVLLPRSLRESLLARESGTIVQLAV